MYPNVALTFPAYFSNCILYIPIIPNPCPTFPYCFFSIFFQRMAEVDAPSEVLPLPPAEVPVENTGGSLEIWVGSVVYKKTALNNALQNIVF